MKRITILFAAALFLWACGDDNDNGNPLPPEAVPTATLEAGAAESDALGFALAVGGAEKAAWICLPAEKGVPDALGILAGGVPVGSGTHDLRAEGLEPGREYVVAAAAVRENVYSETAVLRMTTLDAQLSVALSPGPAAVTSLTFAAEAPGAEKVVWVCLPEGTPGLDVPRFILREGEEVPAAAAGELTASGLEPMTSYTVAAVAVSGERTSPAALLTMTTRGDSPEYLYEALQGEWTAAVPVLAEAGGTETVEFVFPVTITAGVNETTAALYQSRNRLCCVGYMDIDLYYPDDLLALPGGWWQSHPQDADLDWGPKWFLEIAEDGTLSIPAAFYAMTSENDTSWSLRYDTNLFEFLTGADGKTAFIYLPLPEVSVSDDLNAITVHGWDQTNNAGEVITVYPSAVHVNGSGLLSFRKDCRYEGKFCTTIGAGDLVLTRVGSPAASAPRGRAVPVYTAASPGVPFGSRARP